MNKKQWLLAIIVCIGIGYLIVSKVSPEAGWSIDNVVGGAIGNVKAGIESTPIWQQYDVWFGVLFGGVISALLVYKGRDMYDGVRGIARVRATGEKTIGYQSTPSTQAMVIPQATVAAEPQSQPVAVTTEKKET